MSKKLSVVSALLVLSLAHAEPSHLIIARHAEKGSRYALCDMGTERSQALVHQYLGRGAAASLFPRGQAPDAMMAMTMHTIDTITPAAESWNLPVIAYAVMPTDASAKEVENARTQQAARDVLTAPAYDTKTVVMVWEHKRIANAKLEKKSPGVTLRQLLHLDQVKGVPEDWPDQTYDYFWIIDFARGNPVPVSFHMLRQEFTAPFSDLPSNAWGEPDAAHVKAGCKD
ncbi:MAG TPA: hypothetical protein VGG45_02165 [Terracidiphilus sp.]|jgi:hypothetical protein